MKEIEELEKRLLSENDYKSLDLLYIIQEKLQEKDEVIKVLRSKSKAIEPSLLIKEIEESFPKEIFETVNELLIKNKHLSRSSVTILVDEILERLEKKGFKKSDIFDNGWLDFEDIYTKQGWKVKYEQPAYCESFKAFFEFSH